MGRSVRSTRSKRNNRILAEKAKVIAQNRLDSVLAKLEASTSAPAIPLLNTAPLASSGLDAPIAALKETKRIKKSWNFQFDEREKKRKREARQKKLNHKTIEAHKAKVLRSKILNGAV